MIPACLLARDVLVQKQPGDVRPGEEGEAAADQVGDVVAEDLRREVGDAGAEYVSREVPAADERAGGQAVAGEKVTAQGEKVGALDGAVDGWPNHWAIVECLAQMELRPPVGCHAPSARSHAMGL